MYSIKDELLQALLNYLASQPYAQVAGLITEIQKCEKLHVAQDEGES